MKDNHNVLFSFQVLQTVTFIIFRVFKPEKNSIYPRFLQHVEIPEDAKIFKYTP